MDLQDQLKKLFPNHQFEEPEESSSTPEKELFMQDEPIICKYEKKGRNGKPVTILENYNGADEDLKQLAKELKSQLGVGGSAKDGIIVIQGNYRDKIMDILKEKGFSVKRVGG
ncbi:MULTISPECIES: translation initiation factor [unclassified Apibacter]|uniref:translation initiation factor n=1 Tax=unclassified Apibacter TaxID=2630820 RepID=UPI00132B82B9|nr:MULTISPECIES: translation initiation factor [unclassified Apibacter]MCX8676307.1 translation initiation factor [Apibacter sp. B3919]MXO23772.1 translation initiation factor [Apibacter sp. B3924]MXO26550.1 translation initiation factor [Apibacter sp. B3813]MXO28502.1 translation initiation factor [Apibacter sp. B3913]MXO30456.1 translation initiation factor [Apibacter sp. B3912]